LTGSALLEKENYLFSTLGQKCRSKTAKRNCTSCASQQSTSKVKPAEKQMPIATQKAVPVNSQRQQSSLLKNKCQ
jgi:hypothetical protein